MTKKKKHKDKTASGSPSGSTSSVSSETETAKNGVAISVDPDFPSSEGAPPASSKPEDALTDLNGAVTATTADRVNEIPSSEIEGAVTATIEEGEIVTLSEQNGAENSVVTITNVDRPDELSQPKSVGAVTATVEEGEFVPPPSPTPATKQCVPERNRAPRKFVKHQADGNIRKSSANKSLTSRKESHDVVRTQTPAKSLNLATDVETNVATGVSSSAVGVSPAVTIQKDHATQKQLHNSLAGPSRQNDLVVVDLDSAGFISSGISAKGSDTASASGSESLSNEDYHSPEEVDRFIQVMTRQIRKRSNGKARARGPLNL
ncbi:unnamed protein product [Brassica oleracea]|uniref:(rape) hypothetical protein n=1 Tax=Brassica napus TaxID=3708 RepID=A0A816QDV5_BRANA|nr:unnamed protein product [Brassica napus]